MGRISKGLMTGVSGRVGAVIVSSWRGIPYMKAEYKKRTKKISAKEKANRRKFKAAQEWLSPLVGYLRVGFKDYSPTVQGFIAAKSYLMKNAMNEEGVIDPALVKVSFGKLPNPSNINVKVTENGFLEFTWDVASVKGGHGRAQAMLLAYDVKKGSATHLTAGDFMYSGSGILETYIERGIGVRCHVYIAFVSEDRSSQSNSIYLGEIEF
jgi:hypothetical protein